MMRTEPTVASGNNMDEFKNISKPKEYNYTLRTSKQTNHVGVRIQDFSYF